jgi:hypothetical protein
MQFSALVGQVLDLLQRQGRVSYRRLKREFDLEADVFADLKEELLYSHDQRVQEEGLGLVWVGQDSLASSIQGLESQPAPPSGSGPEALEPKAIHIARQQAKSWELLASTSLAHLWQ